MRPADKNSSSCEAALLEQARRVKAIATAGSRVLVYRNVMWALQWMESERDVMYSGRHNGFCLRHKSSGAVWRKDLGDGAGGKIVVLSRFVALSVSLTRKASLLQRASCGISAMTAPRPTSRMLWPLDNAALLRLSWMASFWTIQAHR